MAKTFAQIDATLPHSKKVRGLTHVQRWAYLCAHLSPLGSYAGVFRYPLSVWADDADVTVNEMRAAITAMIAVGLVEYSFDEQVVRIVGWFFKKTCPENASRMASIAQDFEELNLPDDMKMMAAAEFTVGCILRAQRWNPTSTEWGKLRDVFGPFLAGLRDDYQDDFHAALQDQLSGQNHRVRAELCAIMPSLAFYMEAPCGQGAGRVGAYETRRD